jgi:hypothetical protein
LQACTGEGRLRDALFLVRNGVPFDVAFSLSDFERTVWVIIMGELEGFVRDYSTGDWR